MKCLKLVDKAVLNRCVFSPALKLVRDEADHMYQTAGLVIKRDRLFCLNVLHLKMVVIELSSVDGDWGN